MPELTSFKNYGNLVYGLTAALVVSALVIALVGDPCSGAIFKRYPQSSLCNCVDSPVVDDHEERNFVIKSRDLLDTLLAARIPPADSTIIRCPCDETILNYDYDIMSGEEKTQVKKVVEEEEGEGNSIFKLPIKIVIGESYWEDLDPPDISDNALDYDPSHPVGDSAVKIAIVDSGLDDDIYSLHSGEIAESMNMFTFTDDVSDVAGHGTMVFTIIDQLYGSYEAKYYIYKSLDDDNKGTAFSVACAIKCAIAAGVDIINVSLGAYVDNSVVREVIEEDLEIPVLFASKGNDCINTNEMPHYPSDYALPIAVTALNGDCLDRVSSTLPGLWKCTNGEPGRLDFAAPGRAEDNDGQKAVGTSFSAAHLSGVFAAYLKGKTDIIAPPAFVDPMMMPRKDILMNWFGDDGEMVGRYLTASEDCLDVRVVE